MEGVPEVEGGWQRSTGRSGFRPAVFSVCRVSSVRLSCRSHIINDSTNRLTLHVYRAFCLHTLTPPYFSTILRVNYLLPGIALMRPLVAPIIDVSFRDSIKQPLKKEFRKNSATKSCFPKVYSCISQEW